MPLASIGGERAIRVASPAHIYCHEDQATLRERLRLLKQINVGLEIGCAREDGWPACWRVSLCLGGKIDIRREGNSVAHGDALVEDNAWIIAHGYLQSPPLDSRCDDLPRKGRHWRYYLQAA